MVQISDASGKTLSPRLNTRAGVLLGFEAYARNTSGVEQERRLLGSGVDMIVVLELCHR